MAKKPEKFIALSQYYQQKEQFHQQKLYQIGQTIKELNQARDGIYQNMTKAKQNYDKALSANLKPNQVVLIDHYLAGLDRDSASITNQIQKNQQEFQAEYQEWLKFNQKKKQLEKFNALLAHRKHVFVQKQEQKQMQELATVYYLRRKNQEEEATL